MPITQASGAFNVGRDIQLVIQHPLAPGGRVDLPNVMSFKAAQQVANIKIDRLDGVQLYADLPKGWDGSFMVERGSSGVDDLFALIEANWYASGAFLQAQIFQYIVEVNGASSTYLFQSSSLKLSDAGEWKGDASVKQTVNFMASRRLKL